MTEKLYDRDSMLFAFEARVTACSAGEKGYVVRLDRTAFFPEGGGQGADRGQIGPAQVLDVQEGEEDILHYTDRPLPVGEELLCALDGELRLRRMQDHSGEHIVSGLVHRLWGYDNVGFHLGDRLMTMDYNGELSQEQVRELETLANRAVREDLPIRAWYPEYEELQSLDYRSKLALTENIRLVEIPGVDLCACCAPHVNSTGQVGLVKILSAERHRGGTRLSALCGMDALEDYRRRQDSAAAISALLSVPRDDVAPAVERLLSEHERLKGRFAELSMALIREKAAAVPATAGNLCLFDTLLDEIALRELVNLLMDRCGGLAAVFFAGDGEGWRYIIGSRHLDLRREAGRINAALGGRGGGSETMLQGRARGSEAALRRAVEDLVF